MSFAILRIAKLTTTAAIGGSSGHVARTQNTPNADPKKTPSNVDLVGAGATPEANIQARLAQIVKAREAAGGPKLRSDAVPAVEILLTASPEFFEKLDSAGIKAWADHSVKFMKDKYGVKNVVHATLHLDEHTPHIHAYHVPQSVDSKNRPTLSAKRYYGGKIALSKLQTGYAKHVAKLNPELQRGLRRSTATHKTVKQWYTDVNETRQQETLQAPKMAVPVPPAMMAQAKRDLWAEQATKEMLKKVNEALLELTKRLNKAYKQTQHYQSLYEDEKARTGAYRAAGIEPDQLREALGNYKSMKKQVSSMSAQLTDNKALQVEANGLRSSLELSDRRLKAICEAVGIDPKYAETNADVIKSLVNDGIEARDSGLDFGVRNF
jgi:regulator of replication initiation timing